jgi:hypothetical protein
MKNGEDIIIYDPFYDAQDMFINYYCLFLCGLCASMAMSRFEKTKPKPAFGRKSEYLSSKS